jgi:hypothetical protein
MSETGMREKKGRNFKEVIEQEKNKGKAFKKIMRLLSGINASAVYGCSFLFFFLFLDVGLYFLLEPSVLVWAAILVGTAMVSSLLALRITNVLKKNQWKFKSI